MGEQINVPHGERGTGAGASAAQPEPGGCGGGGGAAAAAHLVAQPVVPAAPPANGPGGQRGAFDPGSVWGRVGWVGTELHQAAL